MLRFAERRVEIRPIARDASTGLRSSSISASARTSERAPFDGMTRPANNIESAAGCGATSSANAASSSGGATTYCVAVRTPLRDAVARMNDDSEITACAPTTASAHVFANADQPEAFADAVRTRTRA